MNRFKKWLGFEYSYTFTQEPTTKQPIQEIKKSFWQRIKDIFAFKISISCKKS